jgi:hypothetical protein
MLLSGRMEGIGLSPQRMAGERLLFLAPSYYRGGLNLITTAFQRGVPGKLARQALGATIGGVLLTSLAAMKAAGLSDEEIEERLNPARGKFLKVPVDLSDGKKIEVGYSNILISYARLLGSAADHFGSDKPIDTGADGNPILRWLRGKAAFSPRILTDIVTGKDYFGNRIQPQEAILKAFEPLAVQQILHGEGSAFEQGLLDPQEPGRANIADALVSVFGVASYPGSKSDQKMAVLNGASRQQFGRDYDALTMLEQVKIAKAAESDPNWPKATSSPEEMEGAFALQIERKRRLTGMLEDDSRKKLDKLGKEIPGYLGSLAMNGVNVPLGRRLDRYEELLADEYDTAIKAWDADRLKMLVPEAREKFVEKSLSKAKERAKAKLISESR